VEREIAIGSGTKRLAGILSIPPKARGMVVFAHGSGSSRHSPRNAFVARELERAGFATLLFDLLTEQEDEVYENRFNIPLLAKRLNEACEFLKTLPEAAKLPVAFFGASTGSAAALQAHAQYSIPVFAIVSRGGRPDLAFDYLPKVKAPTLLIVGGEDVEVIGMNKAAFDKMSGLSPAQKQLAIVPKATHLFEEPGALEQVAKRAAKWMEKNAAKN
jgi:pimeloyl-ACP methyl ester carboxylesterase